MKRILFLAVIALITLQACDKNEDKAITFDKLPQQAQTFINTYFSSKDISYIIQDKELFDGDYEVVFANGNKIDFKKNGEWKDVECIGSEVPAGIILQPIKDYVAEKHVDMKIVKIERSATEYEISLSNGMDLKFDLNGKFIRYDS